MSRERTLTLTAITTAKQQEKEWRILEVPGGFYLTCDGEKILHSIHDNLLPQFNRIIELTSSTSQQVSGRKEAIVDTESLEEQQPRPAATHVLQKCAKLAAYWEQCRTNIASTKFPISVDYRDGLENATSDCIYDLKLLLSEHGGSSTVSWAASEGHQWDDAVDSEQVRCKRCGVKLWSDLAEKSCPPPSLSDMEEEK